MPNPMTNPNVPAPRDADKKRRHVIRVCTVVHDPDLATFVAQSAEVPNVATEVLRFRFLIELFQEEIPDIDVAIVDISEESDENRELFRRTVLGDKRPKALLRRTRFIVLCSASKVEYWRRMVLREEIYDYFVIRPIIDRDYLRVQIWRAIRTAVGSTPRDLPAKDTPTSYEPPTAVGATDPEIHFSGKRALIIENDPASAAILCDMLVLEGVNLSISRCAANACKEHRKASFDVILLEPGISGPKVIKLVKEHFPGTPVVVVSARSDARTVNQCVEQGIHDYIVKPVRKDILVSRLSPLLISH